MINLKYILQHKVPDRSYPISDIYDHFEYDFKKHSENVVNLTIIIYVNKIENRITFKIKNGYYIELLTPQTIKLLRGTESKITKDKNGENVFHLENVELVLVHCNLVIMIISKIQQCYIHLFQRNHLVVY